MKTTRVIAFALMLASSNLVACGDGGEDRAAPDTRQENTGDAAAQKVNIVAREYSFDAPATLEGGVVQFTFSNRGNEPHFVGLARVNEGRTFEDVRAALTAPLPSPGSAPAGPPPSEDFGGTPTIHPGVEGEMAFNIPAGDYVFFCQIPAPDGVPHSAKGMLKDLTVTEGAEGTLPEADQTMVATDFAFDRAPSLKAGTNVLRLRNNGRQLHELSVIELASGKTVDDMVAWARQPSGPPPARYLGGVAIKAGEEATATLDLAEGRTYAVICEIPDFLGDFAPHVTKGMHTQALSVS